MLFYSASSPTFSGYFRAMWQRANIKVPWLSVRKGKGCLVGLVRLTPPWSRRVHKKKHRRCYTMRRQPHSPYTLCLEKAKHNFSSYPIIYNTFPAYTEAPMQIDGCSSSERALESSGGAGRATLPSTPAQCTTHATQHVDSHLNRQRG